MLRHIRLCSQQWHKCSWRAQYLFGNQIQSEKVKMNLETIAQVGNIKACCAMYYYVHKNGIRVVGMINSFFEKAIRSDNVEMKLER